MDTNTRSGKLRGVAAAIGACVLALDVLPTALAGTVSLNVTSTTGDPVDGAVVAVYGNALETPGGPAARVHVMDQVDKQFTPRTLVIRSGDKVSFPNSDNIRHHVYSFSPAKTFELPLYHGIGTDPIEFERTGKVAVGCNIHDRMSAHIFVIDAPLVRTVVSGRAELGELPPGNYEIAIHHPKLVDGTAIRRALDVGDSTALNEAVVIALAPDPSPAEETLSPLERKFRVLRRVE